MSLVFAGGGMSVFGLFSLNPAIFGFLLLILLFGGLNILEFKRFD